MKCCFFLILAIGLCAYAERPMRTPGVIASAHALAGGTAPAITSQPSAITILTNTTTNFTVAATGTAPLTYRWQTNSVDVSGTHWGTNGSVLWVTNAVMADSNTIVRCIITNLYGSVTSSAVALTVTNGLGGGGGSAPTIVQSAKGDYIAGQPTLTTTTGNTIVVLGIGQTTNPLITDNKGNTYTRVGSYQSVAGGGSLGMFYCVSATGGAGHIWTNSADFYTTIVVEIAGATAVDTSTQGIDTTSPYTLDITTGAANTLILSGIAPDIGPVVTSYSDSGATVVQHQDDAGTYWAAALSFKTGAGVGTYTSSWTVTSGGGGNISNISLKP